MNTQRIRTLGGAALVMVLAGACSPQMAQTQYSPAEQQWEQYLRTNYPEWRAPQTVPPMAGVQAEPSADILPEFIPADAGVADLPPEPEMLPIDAAAAGGQTYVVEKGDNLWKIAAKFYGKGSQWKKIYEANLDRIPDPANLRPGTELNIPVDGDLVVPK